MKALNLFLAACFAVPIYDGAVAAVAKNSTRSQNSPVRQTQSTLPRNSTTVKSRTASNPTNSARTSTNKNIVSRAATTNTHDATRTTSARTTLARTAKPTLSNARVATNRNSRSGLLSRAAITRDTVMQRDFGKCKTVFFDCMDEFCANKNAQLKRCACSSRANEFNATQKSLDNVEDKLLDFSQRLLQVNMDPDDAAVINRASQGEEAYYATVDKTASKKTLDEIAKKLNADFDSAGNNMSALSWNLDIDSAFDSVDSLSGVSTTAKSGIALRNAALPICREMAAEVCDTTDITLVENSYNMAIEQDCNTVKKAYDTQAQSARTKILESAALLDMTRLNNYQDNNSDDILTCKSKMLDMLTNTNVCGENLTKCLDVSGRYINPTTGEAFLSPNLVNLSTLITRPTSTDSWVKVPQNASFVSYLNAKKKYIEPATKNCQSISDDVWNAFMDDALAKIKLAQNEKLEEVRQSCTTLLTQCLDNANENLAEFDSRALSTFGVISDKTANALCENVRTSCNAIMKYDAADMTIASTNTQTEWESGVIDIAANETYNKIINTCREIGRDCIINSCKSITGNFGLCESINGSVNRHSILTRASCWDDVKNCVYQASDQTIKDIHALLDNQSPQNLYEQMYGDSSVYDICSDKDANYHPCYGSGNANSVECYKCRLTEQIWGNCKSKPDNREENRILIPNDSNITTLLSWFAKNTHTNENENSCATSTCPAGSLDYTVGTSIMCVAPAEIMACPARNILCQRTITTPHTANTIHNEHTNCCESNIVDKWGNCCMNGGVTNGLLEYLDNLFDTGVSTPVTAQSAICTPSNNITSMTLVAKYTNDNNKTHYVFCAGNVTGGTTGSNASINCNGNYVILKATATYAYYIDVEPENCDENNDCSAHYNYDVNYFIDTDAITSDQQQNDGYQEALTAYCPTSDNTQPNKCVYNGNSSAQWTCNNNGTISNIGGNNSNGQSWLIEF